MQFFAGQGLADRRSTTSGPRSTANFTDGFKVASTGDDGKQYFVPIDYYPWAVFYRKSLFADKGYTIPTTWDELKTLAAKMQTDGSSRSPSADKDGWPAMGTFDILNLRVNGYDFHVGLMAGKQKWTDPKVTRRLQRSGRRSCPFHQDARGRTQVAGRRGRARPEEDRDVSPGPVHGRRVRGTQDQADLADLDFFPYPTLGTSV